MNKIRIFTVLLSLFISLYGSEENNSLPSFLKESQDSGENDIVQRLKNEVETLDFFPGKVVDSTVQLPERRYCVIINTPVGSKYDTKERKGYIKRVLVFDKEGEILKDNSETFHPDKKGEMVSCLHNG